MPDVLARALTGAGRGRVLTMPKQSFILSGTHPAAPEGRRNLHWQANASNLHAPVFSGHVRNTAGVIRLTANSTASMEQNGYLLVFSVAAGATFLLPIQVPSGDDEWTVDVANIGSGIITIQPAAGCFLNDSVAPLGVASGQSVSLFTDGTDYYTAQGNAGEFIPVQFQEVPGGALDGVNNLFTLSHTPCDQSVQVFVNGIEWFLDVHFTVSQNTLEFLCELKPTAWLWAIYTFTPGN